jgi:hypothetical protein
MNDDAMSALPNTTVIFPGAGKKVTGSYVFISRR